MTRNRLVGRRVRLTKFPCHPDVTVGSEGTVFFVDSYGVVHVKWDSGIKLGMIPDIDAWEEVE